MKLLLTDAEWDELIFGMTAYDELHWANSNSEQRREYQRARKIVAVGVEDGEKEGEIVLNLSTWEDYTSVTTVVTTLLQEALLGYPATPTLIARLERIQQALQDIALSVAVEEHAYDEEGERE